MINDHYKINLKLFFSYFLIWGIWTGVWIWAPTEELVWGPVKYIIIAIFAPIGIALIGGLFGYQVKLVEDRLRIGFFPFIRNLKLNRIKKIREGSSKGMSIWHTEESFTVTLESGEEIAVPCNNATEIIRTVKSLQKSIE